MFEKIKEWLFYNVYEDDCYDERTIKKIEDIRAIKTLDVSKYELTEDEKKYCYNIVKWALDLKEHEAAAVMLVLGQKYPLLALEGVAEGLK